MVGFGQVMSMELGWQNSRILSCRYHCRWRSRPGGGVGGGRAAGGGVAPSFLSSNRVSSSFGCFLANTTPGSLEENLIQTEHEH